MNRVDFLLELTAVWVAPMDEALIHIEASFKESVESGDHVFASFCCNHIVIDRLFRGDHLDDVFAEAERRLEFVRKVPYQDIIELIGDMKQFIKTMQGRTESLSTFDDEHYNECDYETQLTPDRMATLVCWHYILKLMARYLSGDHKEALQAANEAKQRLWSSIGHVQVCDYTFFSALNLAALYDSASAQEKAEYRQGIDALYQQLAIWETTQPTSFQDKAKLVAAEIARLDGQVEDALRLYEEAIGAAKNNGFIHIEAMAYEAAGRFLLSRGLKRLATGNFQQACRAYGLWGAAGKVNQLRLLYLEQAGEAVSEGDIAQKLSASYRFDVTAVLRATQAISSEIKQAGLLDRLMTTVLELGGADSGQLVMMMGSGDLQQAAAAEAREHGVELTLAEERLQVKAIPRSIVSYVKRTGKKLILDQMRLGLEFADDPYFVSHRPKSVLCLPIYRQDRLIGFLYLENSKVNAAFDENRLAVLDILAAQAAISLENADLFQKRLVAEESLRRNEEKLNAVLQHMVEGVVASDAEGHVILANEPCKEILGVSAIEEGALSLDSYQNLFEIRDKDGKIIETKDLPLAKSLQGEVIIKEMLVLRKYDTDRVLFLEVSAAPIKDNSQDIVGGVLVMRDITDIVGFEKVKEDFLRVVAHELKTPLAIIKGYSQLILKDKSNCPTIAQKSVDRIILGTDRLSALVDDLMDVSMLQMDKLILQPVELDLSKLVTDATNDLADITPSVQFEFDIEPGLYVNGHKSRLIQVMNNLLNNAVKYSPEGGVIWVRAHQDNNQHALVSIKDQGIGIPKNMESRIFQAFYRAHSGGEHDYGGMGVGLFISRSIIMRHSGSIYFHSEEGKGTEMSFHLPLVRLGDDRNAKSDSGRRG
jgi:PAS domain S-box-containing protein